MINDIMMYPLLQLHDLDKHEWKPFYIEEISWYQYYTNIINNTKSTLFWISRIPHNHLPTLPDDICHLIIEKTFD
jgi:hypothetical protein